jgi:hypothetical protein
MNKYISYLADYYSLWQIHQHKSKDYQFRHELNDPIPFTEMKNFYKTPGIPNAIFTAKSQIGKYNFGDFSFPSEIQSGDPANKATGVFYELSSYEKSKANVILIHGWRMESIERVEKMFSQRLMDRKYNLYYYTLPHHFERCSEDSSYNGEFMISANVNRTIASIQQTVSDIRALISFLKNRDGKKVVVIGFSLGGLISNLTSTVEKNIDVLVSLFYLNSLSNTAWNSIPGKFLKIDFLANNFSYEQLKKYWDITEPIHGKPIIPKNNIFLMSALYDKYVDIKDANALWEVWGRPERYLYQCGHSGLVLLKDKLGNDAVSFIDERV